MKLYIKKIIILTLFSIIVFPSFSVIYAQTKPATPPPVDYTVLTPLPNTTKKCNQTDKNGKVIVVDCTNLELYLPAMFNLSVGIAAALAFIMITFGGVLYATSDALSGKADGKKYIENALWGLLLVIGAYTLLNTINPQLLDFKLGIDKIASTPGAPIVVPVAGKCTNCVVMSDITAKNGNQISPIMLPKLKAFDTLLDASGIVWTVTEAYPPSTNTHVCTCHYIGTCIDANPLIKTPGYLNSFVTYAKQAGLNPVYEVKTEAERTKLLAGDTKNNIPAFIGTVKVVGTINAAHFSVYNTTCHQ